MKMIGAQADVLCQRFEAGGRFSAFDQATCGSNLLCMLLDRRRLVGLAAFAGTEPRFFRVFASPVKLHVFRSGETSSTRGAAVNTRRLDGIIELRLGIASYYGGPTGIVFYELCERIFR